MPRKSAASFLVPPISVDGSPSRLHSPPTLSDRERTLFIGLVSSCDASHFRPSDLPLLVRYVEVCALGERAALELRKAPVTSGKPLPWLAISEESLRAIVALSMRLRLSPQSRAPNNPSCNARPPMSYYDRMRLESDHDDVAG